MLKSLSSIIPHTDLVLVSVSIIQMIVHCFDPFLKFSSALGFIVGAPRHALRRNTALAAGQRPGKRDGRRLQVASNRKARFDYHVVRTMEAGIALTGTEVKSCRNNNVNLRDGFARVEGGSVWLHNVDIAPHATTARYFQHEAKAKRRREKARQKALARIKKQQAKFAASLEEEKAENHDAATPSPDARGRSSSFEAAAAPDAPPPLVLDETRTIDEDRPTCIMCRNGAEASNPLGLVALAQRSCVVARSVAAWNSNLQPDFNMRIFRRKPFGGASRTR